MVPLIFFKILLKGTATGWVLPTPPIMPTGVGGHHHLGCQLLIMIQVYDWFSN